MKLSSSGFSKSLATLNLTFISLAGFASCLIWSGCSRFPDSGGPRTYQIPWPTESGDYRLQSIQLKTFTNPTHLEGSLATILVQPFLSRGGLEGGKPVGRFIETSDRTLLIPADFITIQGTVVYAHMEHLQAMDVSLGVTGGPPLWPAKIGIESTVVDTDGLIQNNAIYDGNYNALLIVPFNDGGNMPITSNAGVLAHEHFHAIFQAAVLSKIAGSKRKPRDKGPRGGGQAAAGSEDETALNVQMNVQMNVLTCGLAMPYADLSGTPPEQFAGEARGAANTQDSKQTKTIPAGDEKTGREVTPEEYNAFLLRGFNEGLADFWAWAYTGDTNFIRHSLPKHTQWRTLDTEPETIWSTRSIKDIVLSMGGKGLAGQAYIFGTQYGRFLRHLAKTQASGVETRESRMAMARALVRALPAFAQQVTEKFGKEFLDPGILVYPLLAELGQTNLETCMLYDKFMGVPVLGPNSNLSYVDQVDAPAWVARPKSCPPLSTVDDRSVQAGRVEGPTADSSPRSKESTDTGTAGTSDTRDRDFKEDEEENP